MVVYKTKQEDLEKLSSISDAKITMEELFTNPQILALVGIILISILAHGKIFEKSKVSIFIDGFRLVLVSVSVLFLFNDLPISNWLTPTVLSVCGIMFIWLIKLGAQMKPKTS